MVKGHHIQLRCSVLLFCKFKKFRVKAAAAHCPVIQKEVVRDTIEPSTDDTAFYANVFVVLKDTGGLLPVPLVRRVLLFLIIKLLTSGAGKESFIISK